MLYARADGKPPFSSIALLTQMRSIFIHFPAADEELVRETLDTIATYFAPDKWTFPDADSTTIWCYLTDSFDDWEPEDIAALRRVLRPPSKFVQADVSGRIPGDDVVAELWQALLSAVPRAVVTDDYTNHPWTLAELRSGHRVQGHPFFDYEGWYDETQSELGAILK